MDVAANRPASGVEGVPVAIAARPDVFTKRAKRLAWPRNAVGFDKRLFDQGQRWVRVLTYHNRLLSSGPP